MSITISKEFLTLSISIVLALMLQTVSGIELPGAGKIHEASEARNLRADARYHFTKANEAMDKMFDAEANGDVDEYEKWLQVMRREDQKLLSASSEYEKLRDYLEARIWQGKIVIANFDKLYEKSTAQSIMDHLTFRAEY